MRQPKTCPTTRILQGHTTEAADGRVSPALVLHRSHRKPRESGGSRRGEGAPGNDGLVPQPSSGLAQPVKGSKGTFGGSSSNARLQGAPSAAAFAKGDEPSGKLRIHVKRARGLKAIYMTGGEVGPSRAVRGGGGGDDTEEEHEARGREHRAHMGRAPRV